MVERGERPETKKQVSSSAGPRRIAPGTGAPITYAFSTGTWISVTNWVGSSVSPGLRR